MDNKIKVKDLKHDNGNAFILIELQIGTTHRVDKCIIEPTEYNGNLYHVVKTRKDEKTGALVLLIE